MRTRLSLSALLILLIAATAAFWGCSDNPTGNQTGTVQLRMTDATADYDEVNIVVTEVSIHPSGAGDADSEWEVLETDDATYNLLTLQNGVFATIAHTTVASGPYDQVRLKVGSGSNVVVDGITYPLTIPSGMQSGIKLVGSYTVPPDGLLDLALDFDAARSIHQTGNGTYMLQPVIRVVPFSTAGSISGVVLPPTAGATVYAIAGTDTLTSTSTDALGSFKLSALPAGTYSVWVSPLPAYGDTMIVNVAVSAGTTTNLGNVQLSPQ